MAFRLLVTAVLFYSLLSPPVRAQSEISSPLDSGFYRMQLIKIGLLSPVISTFSAAFETVTSPSTSLQASFFINDLGFGFLPEYRYYISEKKYAPNGFYVAPMLSYQEIEDVDTHFGGGLMLGGQTVYKEKIAIDWYFGPTYRTFAWSEVSDFGLRAGLMLGLNIRSRR